VTMREHKNGAYRISAYYLAKQLGDLPLFLATAIIYNAIFYWMVGLNKEFDKFLMSTIVVIILSQCFNGYGKWDQACMLIKLLLIIRLHVRRHRWQGRNRLGRRASPQHAVLHLRRLLHQQRVSQINIPFVNKSCLTTSLFATIKGPCPTGCLGLRRSPGTSTAWKP